VWLWHLLSSQEERLCAVYFQVALLLSNRVNVRGLSKGAACEGSKGGFWADEWINKRSDVKIKKTSFLKEK